MQMSKRVRLNEHTIQDSQFMTLISVHQSDLSYGYSGLQTILDLLNNLRKETAVMEYRLKSLERNSLPLVSSSNSIDEISGESESSLLFQVEYQLKWKGSEYRNFLLYVGMVVLNNFLKQEEYQHFLKLCCAVTICSSDIYREYVIRKDNRPSLSDCLFNDYIEQYIEIYGSHSISSNVHNLIHITDDVIRFGNLNNISTYSFENRLGMMKNKLKKCNKPLEQIARRINEIKDVIVKGNRSTLLSSTQFLKLENPVASNQSFLTVIFKEDFRLSTKKFSVKWFLAKTTQGIRIIELTKITRSQTPNLVIFGKPLQKKEFFSRSLFLHRISIFTCQMVQLGKR